MADDEKGYGQQDPSDSASPFNQHDFHIRQQLAQVNTVKLVKVVAVDSDKLTVDVQPMVNQVDGQNNVTPHGTVLGVPYSWIQAGSGAFKMTPEVGDKGVMACCDRDISAVLNTKDIAPPGSGRQLDTSDGVYLYSLPGLNDAPDQTIEFTDEGAKWTLKHGNVLEANAAGWTFTGVVTFNGNVQLGGQILGGSGAELAVDIKTTGEVVAGSIGLKAHHHTAQGATAATTVSQP